VGPPVLERDALHVGLFPIPTPVGQLFTIGALGLAFLLALSLNRRLVLRPNAVLTC
jgi:hypothetical protein